MVWPKGRKRGKHTKEHKEKISVGVLRYFSIPGAREKFIKTHSNQEFRKKDSLQKKKYYSNPITRQKISKLLKKYYSNPKARERDSRIQKRYLMKHPEFAERMDRAMTKWWCEHPNIKKEKSIEFKKLFIKNPARFRKFMSYGNNSKKPHLKTKQGFLVRSKGEQKIANFLHDNKISSAYESKTLNFEKEGQICIPDFWLPKFKIYIEFYGGYPAAWKKKVMKNRLYKKYKIPCIFITPAELRDLDYYLKGKLRRNEEQ